MSGNRKDLKCVCRRRRRLCQLIPMCSASRTRLSVSVVVVVVCVN